MVTHTYSTIAKFIYADTVEYFSATLLENPFDDDTREMVLRNFLEARPNSRLAGVVCDSFFLLKDVIEKPKKHETKKQQKHSYITITTPPTVIPPMNKKKRIQKRHTRNQKINRSSRTIPQARKRKMQKKAISLTRNPIAFLPTNTKIRPTLTSPKTRSTLYTSSPPKT